MAGVGVLSRFSNTADRSLPHAGDELYNYLLNNGPIAPEKVQKIFTQLVGAVAYVHNKSCVHRDLKLENILLDKNGNVKLCDFGFTREYEGKASYLQTFCGTICYSAPEMLKAERYAGEKVDVWSLGIILYALLAGELPFDDDDDISTKMKILGEEPKYPDHFPPDAKALISQLLSKRPLLRPSLSEILAHPFLAPHAPQQQVILKLQQPAPFTTKLEKDTLERMRSAGVNIDHVIENVLAQRCDSLAGWWALLIEKEERKEKRRERKRREKEAEARTLRRLSAASSRLDRMGPILREVDEEGEHVIVGDEIPRSRGRKERRSMTDTQLADLPSMPEGVSIGSPIFKKPPPPIEKDSLRSANSSRSRPPLPPKEKRRSRSSTMHLVSSNPDLLSPTGYKGRRPRRHQHPFISQLVSIKHWFVDSAKRAKSPGLQKNSSTSKLPQIKRPDEPSATSKSSRGSSAALGSKEGSVPQRPQVMTSANRTSLSPSPLTPHTYRRTSVGLRGRKSTSSSVSSVRSIHQHHHSHSKASSTSSTSINSSVAKSPRSPHPSVKVLPATPTTSVFPSNIRVVRGQSNYNEAQAVDIGLPAPAGLVFAKRKRSPFKGPMLNVGPGVGNSPSRARESSMTRSASAAGRTSGEIIQEEDEDLVEEVDNFSPLNGPGEVETVFEDDPTRTAPG
ncbi:MAG: hypothetical protein M1819_002775 [Sarea resinae]|nr:MAG: hypothetical protein M1819_002775 [Sarea resinae]